VSRINGLRQIKAAAGMAGQDEFKLAHRINWRMT
jgi:hypothetical protein